jgi:CheY-like chemotaxis protein
MFQKATMNSLLPSREQAVVMVIDGDQQILAALGHALGQAGYSANCCCDAEAAVAAVGQTPPHLIIADVNLRGVGGIQLCDRIRQRDGLADVPVMFLSATQAPDIIRRSYAAGAAYFVRKPFDVDVLLELAETALAPNGVSNDACGPTDVESVVSCPTDILCVAGAPSVCG